MLDLCEKPIIEKIRYEVEFENNIWEIDVFDGVNKGLVVAEVELSDENQNIRIPNWIGEEVSHEPKYYNAALIKMPFSKWT
jgi:CYTH domain-containing protein